MAFTIYSKPNCPFCVQAKALLTQKNRDFIEIHLDFNQNKIEGNTYITREDFSAKFPTRKSLPLIIDFLDNEIGGFTELKEHLEYDF